MRAETPFLSASAPPPPARVTFRTAAFDEGVAGHVQRVLALKTFTGFAPLPPGDLAALAEHMHPRRFESGQVIMREGLPVTGTHFLLEGTIEARRGGKVYRTFGPRDVVGGLAAMTREPQVADYVATSPVSTLEIDRDDLDEVFEESFSIVRGVWRGFARYQISLRKQMGEDCGYAPVDYEAAFPPVSDLWLVERMRLLRKSLPFGNVSVEAIASIAQAADERRLEPGEALWREGDPSGVNVTLLSGIIACHTADGNHRFRFGPGSIVGAVDSNAQVPRWYTAVAETRVIGLAARSDVIVDFIEDHPGLGLEMLRLNARIVTSLHDRLAERAPASA